MWAKVPKLVYLKYITKYDNKGTKGTWGSQSFHKDYTIPNHTNYSRVDPKPLVTASSAIMTVVHFTKVAPYIHEW
jgi:hypothetical protein